MTKFLRMKNIFYLLILTFVFSGCEKVIDVDLNDADPQIVIEGNVTADNGLAEVIISMTSSYFDTVPGLKISDAEVFVTDEDGKKFRFYETGPGIYRSFEMRPRTNTAYKLTVEANGEVYQAESTLKPTIAIDSVTWFYDEGTSFFDAGYYLNVYLLDPAETDNYFRINIYRNGILKSSSDDLIIFNDRFVNGKKLEILLLNDPYRINDTVMVQLISIDENVYEYFKTFTELLNNNPGSAAPANPNSNLSNGALGYFSVWGSDTMSVIIREE
ncbi:MAG TPA: hypothetical protein DER09_03470 [Prolixibacteraceae bacterium]|nr:hypothetical protein [Prolixibacteraceae bacterium]